MLTFNARHAPADGRPFWIALCLASILGCNTGDFYASFFGFLNGLPVLVAAFALVAWLERRDAGTSIAFYWLAIVIVRTAATNLADLLAHRIGIVPALASLTALLLLILLASRRSRRAVQGARNGLPVIDGVYWLTMLVAGTLGTALGDFLSFKSGLGLGGASLALSAWVALLVVLRTDGRVARPVPYWFLVVMIRTAGTSVGDWFAHHIGLWQSTAVFTLALAGFLWWQSGRRSRLSGA